jgi:DNA polymerase
LAASHPALYQGRVAAKSTITETRAAKLLTISKGGLWPFDIKFSGAVQTHRYSGGSGAGGNPQNFPKSGFIRESVQAPEGSELIVGDFAAIELRIIATLAGETKLVSNLRNGSDIYSEFATEFYKRRITKADGVERVFGKTAILGLGYGMGATKFCQTVFLRTGQKITLDEARKAVHLYRGMYPRVPLLWANGQMLLGLLRSGMRGRVFFAPFLRFEKEAAILPSGLKIRYAKLRRSGTEWVYDKWIKKTAPEAVKIYGGKVIENICQALAGEICKLAIERAVSSGLAVAGAVHDEIIAVCESAKSDESTNQLRAIMETPPPWWPGIPLASEVKHAKNWKEAK